MPNFGTGSNLLGDVSALKAAMQSRGMDTSVLDQQTSFSPGYNPNQPSGPTPVPTPTRPSSLGTPNASPTNQGIGNSGGQPGEVEIILKALTDRLKTLSKPTQ